MKEGVIDYETKFLAKLVSMPALNKHPAEYNSYKRCPGVPARRKGTGFCDADVTLGITAARLTESRLEGPMGHRGVYPINNRCAELRETPVVP